MNLTVFVYLMARKRNASVADSKLLFIICLLGLCHTTRGVYRERNVDGEKCIVKQEAAFKTPYTGNILSFITPQQSLYITVSFKNHDKDVHRDVVELSNARVKHYKIRKEGRSFKDQYNFSKQIPEGWSPFKFTAGDSGLTLFHVATKEETLATLPIESMENIGIEGNFSVCSGVSPEWQVSEGDEVGVKVDLQHNVMQQLEVTGDGNILATLKLPGGDADISANTTLTVNTTLRSPGYTVQIFNENTKEWLYIGKLSNSEPVLVLAGRRGNTHLRLKRNNLLPLPATTSPQLQSPANCSVSIVMAIVFAVLLGISLIGNVLCVRRFVVNARCKKGQTSKPQDDTGESESFVKKADGRRTSWETNHRGANEGRTTINSQGASVSQNEQSTAKGAEDDGESSTSDGTTDMDNNNSTEGEVDEHETRVRENRQFTEERAMHADRSSTTEGKENVYKHDNNGNGGPGNEELPGAWEDKNNETWD